MDCRDYRILIDRYLDDRLNDIQKRDLEVHLKGCSDCTSYFENLKKLAAGTNQIRFSGSENYWTEQKDSVLDKIEKEESSQNKIVELPSRSRRGIVYGLTAVAASIALVAIVSIYESRELKNIAPLLTREEKTQTARDTAETKDMEKPLEEAANVETVVKDVEKVQVPSKEVPVKKMTPQAKADTIAKSKSETRPPAKNAEEALPRPLKTIKVQADRDRIDKFEVSNEMEVSKPPRPVPEPQESAPAQIELNKTLGRETPLYAPSMVPVARRIADSIDTRSDIQLNSAAGKPGLGGPYESYMRWKRKLESLEIQYADILSPHYAESAAKSRSAIPPDSLYAIISELAEAYYNTGFYSTDKNERSAMIDKLERLSEKGDARTSRLIDDYISKLESATK